MIDIRPHDIVPPSTTSTPHDQHGMIQPRKKSSLGKESAADEAKIHALRQYNDTDGHFSLVRFVGAPQHLHQTRSEVFANESRSGTGTFTSQTS